MILNKIGHGFTETVLAISNSLQSPCLSCLLLQVKTILSLIHNCMSEYIHMTLHGTVQISAISSSKYINCEIFMKIQIFRIQNSNVPKF